MRQDAWSKDSSPDDAVDAIVGQWRDERPDLDSSAKHITGRIVRLAGLFDQTFGEEFAPLGLKPGDYSLLAPLRRAGAQHALSPTELAKHRMITSGGLTPALDRLEGKGLISRQPHPSDRRSSLVVLTEHGLAVVDEAMARHSDAEQRLVSALDESERAQLADLLRRLLLARE